MIFPTGWGRKCPLIIQANKVDSDLTNFPVLLTEATFPLEMFDADGSYPALSDGGDIRFSSNSDGSSQLACEVVTFSTDNDPNNGKAEIWVGVSCLSSSMNTIIYVWYNKADETQPVSNYTYGSESVWDSNSKMVQHMKDATTSSITDSTSNANDGTKKDVNQPVEADGKVGRAQNFDGSDDYVNLGILNPGDYLMLSAWVYPQTLDTSVDHICSRDGGAATGNDRIWQFRYNADNKLELIVWNTGGTLGDEIGSTVLSENTWYHLVGTWNGTTIRVYVNGVEDGSGTALDGTLQTGTSNSAFVGRSETDDPGYINAIIDELHISNIVRSASWIKACFNNQNDPSTFVVEGIPECVTYYFSGYVFEQNNLVSRKLYLHYRSTSELVSTTTSSGDGYYYMETAFSGSHYIVCLDDAAGIDYNDLIIGPAFPTGGVG